MIGKFLSSPTGKVFMSILWGLGLTALFRRACKGRSCIVYKGPHPSTINGRVFKHDGKCYKYNTKRANCDTVEENNVQLDRDIKVNKHNETSSH
tara:strand:- start:130 stop:411 length:282 start_codon:yes stop_codon:yes gene_type:complete